MSMPSPHGGRGWALFILAAIVIVLGIAIGMPVADAFAEQGDERAQAQADLARARAQLAARPQMQAQLAAMRAREAADGSLLQGANSAVAAANLQSLVKALVERHGGQLRSAQTLATTVSSGLEKITAQFDVSLPLGALKPVSFDLETGSPALIVDTADVRPELYEGAGAGAPSTIRVQWTLHGYRRMEGR